MRCYLTEPGEGLLQLYRDLSVVGIVVESCTTCEWCPWSRAAAVQHIWRTGDENAWKATNSTNVGRQFPEWETAYIK